MSPRAHLGFFLTAVNSAWIKMSRLFCSGTICAAIVSLEQIKCYVRGKEVALCQLVGINNSLYLFGFIK